MDHNETTNFTDQDVNKLLHDLRTPASAVTAGASGLKKFMPILIEAYKKSMQEACAPVEIDLESMTLLEKSLDHVEGQGRRIEQIINEFQQEIKKSSEPGQ